MDTKKEIRKYIRHSIKDKPSVFFKRRSKLICQKLNYFKEKFLSRSSVIALYYPINGEVDISSLIKYWLEEGLNLYLPCVEKNQLIFRKVRKLNVLVPGVFGIMEPPETEESLQTIPDMIIVPGLAFDKLCHRLGRGKGFYDRFLNSLNKKTLTVGLCYDFQVFERLPVNSSDFRIDVCLTESEILWRSNTDCYVKLSLKN